MKQNEIEQKLKEGLVDKEYDQYSTAGEVIRLVKEIFPDKANFIRGEHDRQKVEVKYKDRYLMRVEIKKAKGSYHSTYWGNGYYDWTVKNLEVHCYSDSENPDIEELMDNLDQRVFDDAEQENEDLGKMEIAIGAIVRELGCDINEALSLMDRAVSYRYRYKIKEDLLAEQEDNR